MATLLNWKEIAHIAEDLKLGGLFLERVIVPERPYFPDQYLKGEICFRFTGRKRERFLIVSLRPQRPYLAYGDGKGPKASLKAPRSGFDLSIGKLLKGSKVSKVEAHFQERALSLWFEGGMKISFYLIPAAPEGFLIQESNGSESDSKEPKEPKILSSTRGKKPSLPRAGSAPPDVHLREDLLQDSVRWFQKELEAEAFDLRLSLVKKTLSQKLKYAKSRLAQCREVLRKASQEEDWQAWGERFKTQLGNDSVRSPHFPELNLTQSVQKYFHLAKRKVNRLRETELRLKSFEELSAKLTQSLLHLPSNWKELQTCEASLGAETKGSEGKQSSKPALYSHKSFLSKEQQLIWVGRSKQENLELTFKQARGNDLWMHVKGRPGAHVVLSLPSGKSASLESLLDAAQLALHYSGGANWGKTEIDYTFRKYVKRIKDSSEVSYSQNKTLLVEPDPERLKRLLGQ